MPCRRARDRNRRRRHGRSARKIRTVVDRRTRRSAWVRRRARCSATERIACNGRRASRMRSRSRGPRASGDFARVPAERRVRSPRVSSLRTCARASERALERAVVPSLSCRSWWGSAPSLRRCLRAEVPQRLASTVALIATTRLDRAADPWTSRCRAREEIRPRGWRFVRPRRAPPRRRRASSARDEPALRGRPGT